MSTKKASISVILVMVFVLGLFSPMSQHAKAAIPVPHNLYGHAWDYPQVNFSEGEFMSAWIDGVMYGWNWTFDDLADPGFPTTNYSSKIDIDTAGNQVTIPGDPDTPWVKEGGDEGTDDIMYVWGDMTDQGNLSGSPNWSRVFDNSAVWHTFVSEYINLTVTAIQPPASPKINNIIPVPDDAGNQYIYVYGPPGSPMDEYYLEKNDGMISNIASRIFLSGTISETSYFYVDLGATDYLDPFGDELKLIWENPGGPGTPFGGMDVVVDRVEYNNTISGTHYGEPDNTIMPDAAGGPNGLRRQIAGGDTNDCLVDFVTGMIGRPPEPPYPLSVEGAQATGPGQTIARVTNRVNPSLGWTHQDPSPPGDLQFGYHIEVANDAAFTDIRWSSYQPGNPASSENYGGPALDPGTCYYYRARTKDANEYGEWANTTMCMNSPPDIPVLHWPHNETVDPIDLILWWNQTDDPDGDPVTFYAQTSTDAIFSSPQENYTGANNFTDALDYSPLTTYWWRVRAYDGYEYSAWSNMSGYWWFDTLNIPVAPEALYLAVETFYAASPDILHITNLVNPLFNWTFHDDNPGELQQAYEVEVGTLPGQGNGVIWTDSGGSQDQVNYAGAALSECTNYYFRVRVQDDSANNYWSTWEEVMIHTNCIPTIPVLANPPNASTQLANPSQQVFWASSTDADFDTIDYEWVVDLECPATLPYEASGTTSSTSSTPFATTDGNDYYWTVRAGDGYSWSAWAECFVFYVRPAVSRPDAATNLAVNGETTAPGIDHIIGSTPTYTWQFNDPNPGDTQGARNITITTGAGGTGTVMWMSNTTDSAETAVHAGTPLEPCTNYYFRILTADDGGLWAAASDWAELAFHTNCVPTVPSPTTPADGSAVLPSTTQTVAWAASTDDDMDTIYYTVQVADNIAMSSPFVDEQTTSTVSSQFTTTAGMSYYWRVNATDGLETSAWSSIFSFGTGNAPDPPVGLAVEGYMSGTELVHILVSDPTFNWTFVDPDVGDTQGGFELWVWTGSGGTGTDMWNTTQTTSSMQVDYAGTALTPGDTYYFRVRTKDASLWSGWSELAFELNGPPPVPTLLSPAVNATLTTMTPTLTWQSGGADPNGDTVTYWWYVDTDTSPTPPYTANGTTSGLTATTSVLTSATNYYWMACAGDGWEQPNCSTPRRFTTPTNADPVADAGPDQEVTVDETVNFDGTGSSDSDGTIVSYQWDFGDTTSGTGATPTHSYSQTGTYTVTLTVTDNMGATDTDTMTVTVSEAKGFLEEFWWIILILIIIIVVIIIILLARRKKPEEEEEEAIEPLAALEEEIEEAPAEEAVEEEKVEMKECPNCGTVLAADDTECFMCGAKV